MKRLFCLTLATLLTAAACIACTAALVPGCRTASGRPTMWKHRDTGAKGNFVERVEASDTTYGYVALFNDGDSLLREAWMGMNDQGFAIMNTAVYDQHPYYMNEDGEGLVMSMALRCCTTVDEFEAMLRAMYADGPATIGINANFGVMDAEGGLAFIEADDYGCTRFDAVDSMLVRTNFSFTAIRDNAKGKARYATACRLLAPAAQAGSVTPLTFTEGPSRSFWQSDEERDYISADGWVPANQDFIPRTLSTASIVIEGGNGDEITMWAELGYPPCAVIHKATIDHVADELRPTAKGWESPACQEANRLRDSVMRKGKDGEKEVNMPALRPIMQRCSEQNRLLMQQIAH